MASQCVIKLPLIHSLKVLPLFMWTMLPLMVLFSLPLASSMAVHNVISTHWLHDELVLARYLPSLYSAIRRAVVIFACLCSATYALFVFYLAPSSYLIGKQLLIHVAQEQFLQLDAHKFHTPYHGITFFFKEKTRLNDIPIFHSLLLVFATKHDEYYFFTASRGMFSNNTLVLYDGTLSSVLRGAMHTASFDETSIDVLKLISKDQEQAQRVSSKFLSLNQLLVSQSQERTIWAELHKRLAQTVWQLLLPIMLFCIAWGLRKTSLITTIVWSGGLYLLSYVAVIFGQSQSSSTMIALMILYGTPLCVVCGVWYHFLRRRR